MWFGFVVIDVISKPLASLMTKISMMMIITKMKMVKMMSTMMMICGIFRVRVRVLTLTLGKPSKKI